MKYKIHKDEIESLSRWGFECPKCFEWNEIEKDPEYEIFLTCEHCGTDSKIVEED